jgi:hypothetical protein
MNGDNLTPFLEKLKPIRAPRAHLPLWEHKSLPTMGRANSERASFDKVAGATALASGADAVVTPAYPAYHDDGVLDTTRVCDMLSSPAWGS